MIQEFGEFLARYNIVGLAVGLLIGVKIGELVKSLIDNLVTPLILNPLLTKLKVKEMGELSYKGILYGKVMSSFIDFLVIAILVFFVVKYADVTVK